MNEPEKNLADGNLTQKEIIQLLLHNAQHMATREEVKADIKELKSELREDNKELKEDLLRVETSLKEDTKNLSKRLDRFMFWTLGLVTTSTFLILGFMYKWIVK